MKKIFTVVLMSMFITIGWAQWNGTVAGSFAGGNGSEAAPYEIATASELAYLSQFVTSESGATGMYFKLMNDLNLSGGNNWSPIGNVTIPFQGHFDGNGHIVENLTIGVVANTASSIGLFGTLQGGSIKGVTVKNISITGTNSGTSSRIGGFIGYLKSGSIEQCAVTGVINIQGATNANKFGGFIGYVGAGTIDQCFSIITLNLQDATNVNQIGGFLGRNEANATISNCYSKSTVTVTTPNGTEHVQEVGDFAGTKETGPIKNSYSYGSSSVTTSSKSSTGYFIGYSSGTMTNCFMNQDSPSNANGGVSKISDEFFKSTDIIINLGANIWRQDKDESINGGLPVLAWQGGTEVVPITVSTSAVGNGIVAGAGQYILGETVEVVAVADYGYTFSGWSGDATGTDNVLVIDNIQENKNYIATFTASSVTATANWNKSTITSISDLMAFSDAVKEGNSFEGTTITLMNDLVWDNTMNWQPIGNSTVFAGTFDGNGHSIQGLRIYKDANYQGLFGYVTGTVKKIGIVDANVMAGGNGKSAILVGYLKGASAVVENSFVSGEFGMLNGGTDVGSVVGRVEGGGATVRNCFSFAAVEATGGGTGGVVGTVEANSIVSSCYYAGQITSIEQYPTIVGYIGGNIENCFFDAEVTGVTDAADGTTAATTVEMKSAAMVDNLNGTSDPVVWKLDANNNINQGYPALVWQVEVSTDIPLINTQKELVVYQSGGLLTIKNVDPNHSLVVYSLTGVSYKTYQVTNSEMNIDLPEGMWILSNGNAVKKIVIN